MHVWQQKGQHHSMLCFQKGFQSHCLMVAGTVFQSLGAVTANARSSFGF
jgi:hypothetical protein